jgi:hypothetical protein
MNPYQPPQSNAAAAPQQRSAIGVIPFAIGLICAVLVALVATVVVPRFEQVYVSFGAELSRATRFVLKYYLSLWLLPLAVVATRMMSADKRRGSWVACLIGVGGLLLLTPPLVFALYNSIFALGRGA